MADDELSYVEVDDEGFKRGGPVLADDDALSDEDRAALVKWWHGLIEDRAYGGRTHYTMPAVRGMAPPGSFRIPRDVFAALGDGDLKVGGQIVHTMLGIEDSPERPDLVHPHAVRILGGGSLAAGQKVLQRFVSMVRRQSRNGVILHHDGLQHDDGGHGWSVGR